MPGYDEILQQVVELIKPLAPPERQVPRTPACLPPVRRGPRTPGCHPPAPRGVWQSAGCVGSALGDGIHAGVIPRLNYPKLFDILALIGVVEKIPRRADPAEPGTLQRSRGRPSADGPLDQGCNIRVGA